MPEDTTGGQEQRLCPGGHPVDLSAAYCPTCGLPVKEAAAPDAVTDDQPSTHESGGQSGAGWAPTTGAFSEQSRVARGTVVRTVYRNRVPLAILLAVVLVLVVTSLAIRGLSGGGSSDGTASASGDSQSSNQICTNQLYATFEDMQNTTDGQTRELYINGASDPFVQWARTILSTYRGQLYSVGRYTASNAATQQAASICAQNGNPVRPNYPTNGYYPTQ